MKTNKGPKKRPKTDHQSQGREKLPPRKYTTGQRPENEFDSGGAISFDPAKGPVRRGGGKKNRR